MVGRRILVTGVTGMMGRALARYLAPDNTVYGVARFRDHAMRAGLEQIGVQCIVQDLRESDLSAVPVDVDTFMHFAIDWQADPAGAMEFNGYLVGRLLDHLPQLEQFVIASTVAVYVGGGRYELTEQSPTIPGGVYGTSKLAGDILATHIARRRQLPGAVLRYWFPYTDEPGVPQDYYQGLLCRLEAGDTFVLPEDDSGCQQPLFIDDLARITVDSLRFASTDPFVLNVAGPERLTPKQIVFTLAEVFDVEPKVEFKPLDQCSLLSGSYDLRKLSETCGPGSVRFRQGIERLRLQR